MRFLIHSSDSTYDATTKKFTVTLDKRVSNPSQLSVVGASFGASTQASYPLVVYLRSDWAQKLARTKHTVELKGNDHENPSNVLGVLRRHNSDSKFVLDRPFRFPIHGHTVERVVDFYFTDGASKLNGVYTPVEVPGTTDAMMEAYVAAGDIVVWIDLSKDGNVLNNSDDQAAIDDSVSKIISRTPGGSLQMSPNGVDKVKFVALGEANAVTGQASSGSIAGNIAGVDDLDEGNHFFLFKSPADANGLDVLWQSGSLHAFVWGDTIQFKDDTNAYVNTGLVVLDSTDYLLRFKYTALQTQVYLTKLSDLSVQVVIDQGPIQDPGGTNRSFSTAQANMNSYHGDYVHCTEAAALDVTKYLKQRYKGDTTVPVVDPDGIDASWQIELDIDTK